MHVLGLFDCRSEHKVASRQVSGVPCGPYPPQPAVESYVSMYTASCAGGVCTLRS